MENIMQQTFDDSNIDMLIIIIKEYMPDEVIHMAKDSTGRTYLKFMTNKFIVTFMPTDTLDYIKRKIDAKSSVKHLKKCPACDGDDFAKHKLTCNTCLGHYCMDCFISIYKDNNGIVKCPHCDVNNGEYVPDELLNKKLIETLRGILSQSSDKIGGHIKD